MAFSYWPCREVEVLEEEDVRGDRGLSVFRLRAVSRLTLVVRCTEIGYSVSTQVLGFRFGCGWCCVVGVLFGCCWFCVLLLGVSAWWNRGILDEVTKASFGRAVTGTAVMARSANEKKKMQVTVLIPGPLSVDDWLDKLGTLSHAWPQPHQLRSLQVTRVSAQAFEAARVSAAVKHLWPGLRPQWTTIYSTLRLEWPGVYDPSVLHGKFFDNVGQSDHTQDSQYQGKHWWWVFQRFRANQGVMAQRLTISEPWGFGSWQANMVEFEDTLRLERAELDSCEETRKANHQYRMPHGTYRIKRTQ